MISVRTNRCVAASACLARTAYSRVSQDPLLAPGFANMAPAHVEHVTEFIAEVFGGPQTYSEQRGGHAAKIRKHFVGYIEWGTRLAVQLPTRRRCQRRCAHAPLGLGGNQGPLDALKPTERSA